MHVFIDTNILLNFFHYSKDELESLTNVFGSHKHGSATVHLTQQVRDEFRRNREGKIKDAMKRYRESRSSPQFPSFMKGYEEYESIRALDAHIQKFHASISQKVAKAVAEEKLVADLLIGEIFAKQKLVPVTETIYHKAKMRLELGNPPGKNNSLGDAVNWTILLGSVPASEDLHIISEDGDFYSPLDDLRVHPFLADEWKNHKGANLFAYRTLSKFLEEHFDGVAFAFDKEKQALIDSLFESPSYSSTHSLIGKLDTYSYFSAKEVEEIFEAAKTNSQFGDILGDDDVAGFFSRIAEPHLSSLSPSNKLLLKEMVG